MTEIWVLDATMGWPPCFCPVELGDDGNIVNIVVGLNFITMKPPDRVVAIVHRDGQEAVESLCKQYATELKDIGLG